MRNILIVIASIFMFACSSGSEDREKSYTHEIIATTSYININIDEITLPVSKCTSYLKTKDGLLLYYLNKGNEIIVFDIKNEKKLKSIFLDEVGPNGIGKIKYFSIL